MLPSITRAAVSIIIKGSLKPGSLCGWRSYKLHSEKMDALEKYQDLTTKKLAGFIPVGRILPRSVIVGIGPSVQQRLITMQQWVQPRRVVPEVPGEFDRVYLHHVRKTAGTSLVRSFLALGGEDPRVVEQRIASSVLSRTQSGAFGFATGIGALRQGSYYFGWSHAPSHKLHLAPRTFQIALLRDPVERVLSYYRYLVAGDQPTQSGWTVQAPERNLAGSSFTEFLDRVPDQLLLNQLFMYSASYDVDEAVGNLLECQELVRSESFGEDVQRLSSVLGISLDVRKERVTAHVSVVAEPSELERLRERLDPEYKMIEKTLSSWPGIR